MRLETFSLAVTRQRKSCFRQIRYPDSANKFLRGFAILGVVRALAGQECFHRWPNTEIVFHTEIIEVGFLRNFLFLRTIQFCEILSPKDRFTHFFDEFRGLKLYTKKCLGT